MLQSRHVRVLPAVGEAAVSMRGWRYGFVMARAGDTYSMDVSARERVNPPGSHGIAMSGSVAAPTRCRRAGLDSDSDLRLDALVPDVGERPNSVQPLGDGRADHQIKLRAVGADP